MRNHPLRRRLLLPALLLPALLGCGGDAMVEPPPTTPPVVGDWLANVSCQPPCSFVLRAVADPDLTLDLLSFLNGELRVEVTTTRFDLRFEGIGEALEISGEVEIGATELVVTGAEGTERIGYTVQDDQLELRFQEETRMFDLDGDGTADPARLDALLLRQ